MPTAGLGSTSYTALASYYDRLMAHVDYDAWLRFVLGLLHVPPRLDDRPARILDLACGTGTFSLKLAQMGYDVVAVDGSEAMLAVADHKARRAGVRNLLFSCQDLTEFAVAGPCDGAVCLFDSLNYLVDDGALETAFRRVSAALKAGAPFVFDLHSEARLREFAERPFTDVDDEVAYIWESEYDERRKVCTMYVTLFERAGRGCPDGLYARRDEVHVERAYARQHVAEALDASGFDLEGTFGELKHAPPAPDEGRCFYLARRRGDG